MPRRNRAMSCMRSAAAPCSADTDSPACSTIAPRDGAYCRASLSSARLISVSPAADAPFETRGGGVASKARADATCGRNPSAMKSEDVIAAKGRPFTGAEYLASLRDGPDVYIYGERVDHVTTHPAFRNAARSIARLYDALHDAKTKDVLTWPTDTGSGGYTHKFFRAARSREELIAQRDAIAQWARMSYGWMGRSPDYKASLMN